MIDMQAKFAEIETHQKAIKANRVMFDSTVQNVESIPSCPDDLCSIVAEVESPQHFDLAPMKDNVISYAVYKDSEIVSAFIGPTFVAVFAKARQAA